MPRNREITRFSVRMLAATWLLVAASDMRFAAVVAGQNAKAGAAPRRPSILLIMPDQMRGQDMGCMGNAEVQTPNLDKLASQGLLFRNTFANTPVCCPARAIILTGKYAHENGVVANDLRLRESATTIAEVLAAQGYRTGFIGKWHLDGGRRLPGFIPPGPRRLREGGFRPHQQTCHGIEVREEFLGPELLVPGLLAGQMTCHDRRLELAAHHIAEIGPIMSRLGGITPEDVEIRQSVLVHHVVEVVVRASDAGLDGERPRRLARFFPVARNGSSTAQDDGKCQAENDDWSHGCSPGSLLAIMARSPIWFVMVTPLMSLFPVTTACLSP